MPSRPNLACARCGKPMSRGKKSLPPGEATCFDCRRQANRRICQSCGTEFHSKHRLESRVQKYCSRQCTYRGLRCRTEDDPDLWHNRVRRRRDRSAPGLSFDGRMALLRRWQRQGRGCAYCSDGAAEQVDHVIPLSRGGTNFEGNLLPACGDCNTSKGRRLLVEWRLNRREAETVSPPTIQKPPQRVKKAVKPSRAFKLCLICGCGLTLRETCSPECSAERNRRRARDRYRERVGLPVDPTEPTAIWTRRRRSTDADWIAMLDAAGIPVPGIVA